MRVWSEADRVVMLQSVLTGKVLEAYSTLGEVDSQNYSTVTEAVLKAYELIQEANRQRFGSWRKSDKQSHVEFVRNLTKHFNRCCSALEITSFKDLCDLMVQEQFTDCVPPEAATEAAALTGEYVAAH